MIPANRSKLELVPVLGEQVKTGRTDSLVLHWTFDEAMGQTAKERITGVETPILGANAYWKNGVSGTCLVRNRERLVLINWLVADYWSD